MRSEGTLEEITRVEVGGDIALVGHGFLGTPAGDRSMSVQIVDAARIRALVDFEDLVEPVSSAFQDFSAGLAQCAMVTMFPASEPTLGDVYIKTGCIRRHSHYLVKVSPWFAVNQALAQLQGGFLALFDSATGHTVAILNDEHYLSDIRTAPAGALAARVLAPESVHVAGILGSGVQAYWQSASPIFGSQIRKTCRLGSQSGKDASIYPAIKAEAPGCRNRGCGRRQGGG